MLDLPVCWVARIDPLIILILAEDIDLPVEAVPYGIDHVRIEVFGERGGFTACQIV